MSLWHALRDLCGIWGLIAFCPLYLLALLRGDQTGRAFAHVLALGALLGTLAATGGRDAGTLRLPGDSQPGLAALLFAGRVKVAMSILCSWRHLAAVGALFSVVVARSKSRARIFRPLARFAPQILA